VRATLCALIFALAVWPLVAHADDAGDLSDVRALEHDLPILRSLQSPITVESMRYFGIGAIVAWRIGHFHERDQMLKRYDRWWFVQILSTYEEPSPQPTCTPGGVCLTSSGGISLFTPEGTFRGPVLFGDGFGRPLWTTDGGYRVGLHFAQSDSSNDAAITDFRTRIPTQAESWITPGGNSYFFFSGTVKSEQPVHVHAGTTLDVWFPFVLDDALRYSITLAAPHLMSIGPIDGTLKDNTLHFTLPAFTAPPGADLMGEIESD
jgi:hypothetical protein